MQKTCDEIKANAGDGTKTVYFEVSPLQYGLWTAGSGAFMDEIANMLGLGWAATPAGLKAMEELEALEEERRRQKKPGAFGRGTASNEMCTFLIVNISSLQLIPINMIAYRSQYGSVNPTAVVGPGIVATAVSTGAAILFCRIMDRKS